MRKLGILLVLATIVVAGCKSGKQTDGKGENEVDSALQVKVEAALLEGMKPQLSLAKRGGFRFASES